MQYTLKYEDESTIVVSKKTDLRNFIASGYEIINISCNDITLRKPAKFILDDDSLLSSRQQRISQKKLAKALHKCLETGEFQDILKKHIKDDF